MGHYFISCYTRENAMQVYEVISFFNDNSTFVLTDFLIPIKKCLKIIFKCAFKVKGCYDKSIGVTIIKKQSLFIISIIQRE